MSDVILTGKKALLISGILVIIARPLKGQDELGIAGSTRAPVNTAYFNPASICDSRAFLDIQLSGFDVFIQNNLLFIPRDQYSPTKFDNIGTPGINKRPKSYYFKAEGRYRGPSFVANLKQHAFGLQSGVNVMLSNLVGLS